MTVDDIVLDLVHRDFLYNYPSFDSTHTDNDLEYAHLTAWSTSTTDYSGKTFAIRASIDRSASYTDNHVMHEMHCTLVGRVETGQGMPPTLICMSGANSCKAQLDKIASKIPSVTTLGTWVQLFQGYINGLDTRAVDYPEATLEWYLNTRIMVAGGSSKSLSLSLSCVCTNYVVDYLLSKPPQNESTQGCLKLITIIPDWFIGLMMFTILACFSFAVLAVYLWYCVQHHALRSKVKHIPIDVLTWISQAVPESNVGPHGVVNAVQPKHLKNWNVELSDGPTVRIERKDIGL